MNRLLAAALLLAALPARAADWEDATGATIGTTAGWSNKVELGDVDDDGDLDILFANGGDYNTPGTPAANTVFLNQGPGLPFVDGTTQVFGDATDLSRVIKVRDLDLDGDADILVGTCYQRQTRLWVGDALAGLTEVTADRLPDQPLSVGDLEVGDVDGDGDLDIVLADWGPGDPFSSGGGRTRLWLNDDALNIHYTDVTETQMPDVKVGMSWELELVDVDNDWDLDILVSSKLSPGSFLFENDGAGHFTDAGDRLPQFTNNYEFEAMDLDADGLLDLVTINDGPGATEHVFRNTTGTRGYEDVTADWWPAAANPSEDDNMVAFLDVDSDGDADFVIGSLSGPDRLLLNDGLGHLSLDDAVFTGASTPGTLGLAIGDLNDDGRPDVVQAQGEVAFPDKVFLGVDIFPDTAAPEVARVDTITGAVAGSDVLIRARVHDRMTPVREADLHVVVEWFQQGGVPIEVPMRWTGESLWRTTIRNIPLGTISYQVCAADRRVNAACSPIQTFMTSAAPDGGGPPPDAGNPGTGDGGGCGCRVGQSTDAGGSVLPIVIAFFAWRIRRRSIRRERPRSRR